MIAPSREAISAKAAAQLAAFFISIAFWHQPDQPGRSDDIRCSGQTGSGWQWVKTAPLPKAEF